MWDYSRDLGKLVIISTIAFIFFVFILPGNDSDYLFYSLLAALAIFIFGLVFTIKVFKERSIIKNIPHSKIRSVAIGLSEIVGTAKSITTLKTPISNQDCVYYRYIVRQYVSGKNSSWELKKDEASSQNFLIKDETGEIEIDPSNVDGYLRLRKAYFAPLNLSKIFSKDESEKYFKNLEEIPIVDGKEKSKIRFPKDGDRKYYEYYLLPGDDVYVLGTVSAKEQSDKLFIHKGINDKYFILGNNNENTVLKQVNRRLLLLSFLLVLGVFGLAYAVPLIFT